MKIDEIAKEIMRKRNSIISNSRSYDDPKLVVYIDYDYWIECVKEIHGEVSQHAFNFQENSTIMGYDVWRVTQMNDKGLQKKHAPFLVVEV